MSPDDDWAILESKSRKGHAESTLILAELLRNGNADAEEVKSKYMLAIDQGLVLASLSLANFLEYEAQDEVEALFWYKVACQSGLSLACARLALAYQSGGLGLPVDGALAKSYSKRAIEIESAKMK